MKQITCPHCGDTYPDFDVAHVCSQGPYAPKLKPKMNERIQELAQEANAYAISINPKDGDEFEAEFDKKFAELIVRECIDTVSDSSVEYATRPQIVNEIKQHFGVEE